MNTYKIERGITLIALVITIVLLLILAGVTLNLVFNGGLIEKSQTAVDTYSKEQAKEKLLLDISEYKMGTITGEYADFQNYIRTKGSISEEDNKYKVLIYGYEFILDKETLEIESGNKGDNQTPSTPEDEMKIITAESILYIPENSEWKVENVKDALDDLYIMYGGQE